MSRRSLACRWLGLVSLSVLVAACAIGPSQPLRVLRFELEEPAAKEGMTLTIYPKAFLAGRAYSTGGGAIGVPVESERLAWGFSFVSVQSDVQALEVALKNSSREAVMVLWDQASLTGADGLSRRIIHKGVRLLDRSVPMAASTVPPGGLIEDFVFPSDLIAFTDSWTYSPYFERFTPGDTVTLYLPVHARGAQRAYAFRFRVR